MRRSPTLLTQPISVFPTVSRHIFISTKIRKWLGICNKRERNEDNAEDISGIGRFCASPIARSDGYDVFVPIAKYIGQGDATSFPLGSRTILRSPSCPRPTIPARIQAKQILKSFFSNYTPRSEISHTASRSNSKYALGYLTAGGEVFMVTIFVSNSKNEFKIQQLKIDRIR